MKKNIYVSVALMVAVAITFLYSCKKYQLNNTDDTEHLSTEKSTDQLLMQWAQANSGRWLPYSIRLAFTGQDDVIDKEQQLAAWAEKLRPVNAAKAYYRVQLGQRLGRADKVLDSYLDSVYLWRYKQINQSLRYQRTLDSLMSIYASVEREQQGKPGAYIAGMYTKAFQQGTGRKITMALTSGNPNAPVTRSPNCIPGALTDWFDQQYDGLYTKIMNNRDIHFPTLISEFYRWTAAFSGNTCTRRLLGDFFESSLGYGWPDDNHMITINCGQATDSISRSLMNYYSCLGTQMPQQLTRILADGDPFEDRYANVYLCKYQLDALDQAVLNQIHQQDEQANAQYLNARCGGVPNMAGNMFFPGVREHMIIQLHYLTTHPKAEREYWIPQTSGNNPLNPGRADLANPLTGEMFEIKPVDNSNAMNAGINEVNNYVAKANQFCISSLRGPSLWNKGNNFTTVTLPFSPTQNLQATLSQPGLIGYRRIPRNGIPDPIVLPQSVAEKFKRLVTRLQSIPNFTNGNTAERIIIEFLRAPENRNMVNYLRTAAVGASLGLIIGTIMEDFASAGIGIADDLPCFMLSYRIARLAFYY